MKKIPLLLFFILLSVGVFAQKTLQDSIINARDYVAAKLVYLRWEDFISNDPSVTDSARAKFLRVKSVFNRNSLIQPISNEELTSILTYYNILGPNTIRLLHSINAIPNYSFSNRIEIPTYLINEIYEIPSSAVTCKECINIKNQLRNEVNTYFNGNNKNEVFGKNLGDRNINVRDSVTNLKEDSATNSVSSISLNLNDSIINARDYVAAKLIYTALYDMVTMDLILQYTLMTAYLAN